MRNYNSTKRPLAILLSILMIMMLIPIATLQVSADVVSVATEAEFEAALTNALTANVITLNSDLTLTKTHVVKSGVTTTIDFNGFKMTYTPVSGNAITMPSSITYTTHIKLQNTSPIPATIETNSPNEFLKILNTSESSPSISVVSGEFNGDISANKKLSLGTARSNEVPVINGNVSSGADLALSTATVNGNVNAVNLSSADQKAVVPVTVTGNVTANTISVNRSQPFIVTGSINATKASFVNLAQDGGTLNVNTLLIKNSASTTVSGNITSSTAFLGLGGTFNGNIESDNLIITNGQYNSNLVSGSKGTLIGGKFVNDPSTIDNAEVKGTVVQEETLFGITDYFVAELVSSTENNGLKFTSIDAAMAVAQAGDTIKVIADIFRSQETGFIITTTKSGVTVDLNGKNITDFSDVAISGGAERFLQITEKTTDFVITDSTYTPENGGSKITLYPPAGDSNNSALFIMLLNATSPTQVKIENLDFTITGTEDNNSTIFKTFGSSTSEENSLSLKNTNIKYTGPNSGGGTGFSGFVLSQPMKFSLDNCDIYSNRHTVAISNSKVKVNIKNTKLDAYKAGTITQTSFSNVNIENSEILGPSVLYSLTANSATSAANSTINIKNTKFVQRTANAAIQINDSTNYYSGKALFNLVGCTFENNSTNHIFNVVGNDNTINVQDSSIKLNNKSGFVGTVTAGSTINLYNTSVESAAGVTNEKFAFYLASKGLVTAVSKVNLHGSTISGIKQLVSTTNAYNEFKIYESTISKNNTGSVWANATSNVVLADGSDIYSDAEGTTSLSPYDWKVDKTQNVFVKSSLNKYAFKTLGVISNVIYSNGPITMEPSANLQEKQFVAWSDGEDLYKASTTATFDSSKTFEAVGVKLEMSFGAQVRLKSLSNGIRYLTMIDKADFDTVSDLSNGVEMGTRIAPIDLINENFTGYAKAIATNFYERTENYYGLAGSIVNLKESNLEREFVGQGYLTFNLANDEVVTIYATNNNNNRSIVYLANAALDDVSETSLSNYPFEITLETDANVGKFSPYTAQERAVLQDYIDRNNALKV